MNTHTEQSKKQRRFLMALPLLVLPFLIMIFWALGGGEGTPAQAMDIIPGLNPELPQAQLPDDAAHWNKLSLYETAKRDSIAFQEAKRNDPYFRFAHLLTGDTIPDRFVNASLGEKNHGLQDETEKKVVDRINSLYAALDDVNENATVPKSLPIEKFPESSILDSMTDIIADPQGEQADPELDKLDGMLDKLIRLQQPSAVNDGQNKPANSGALSFSGSEALGNAMTLGDSIDVISIEGSTMLEQNGFFGADVQETKTSTPNAIEAVIDQTQSVVSGAVIRLRLLQDAYVNGKLIAASQFIYGICNLSGERLTISITSLRSGNAIYPVDVTVYDLDGLEGIYVPGAIARDAAKQSTSQSIQGIDLLSMDTSLASRAADVGVQTAKGFFGRKTKLVKATLTAGYHILLVDNSTQQ